MLVIIPSYCFGFETNNTEYDTIGVFTSGNDDISNSDYDTDVNIGQQVVGSTNNTEYTMSLGFFYSTVIEPYPVIGEEIFGDNVYADNYETANATLSLDPIYYESHTFNYTIPYNINDVNISSIQVQNISGDNISFTRSNNIITVITDGDEDPYYITYDVKAVKKMTVSEYGSCPVGYQTYVNYCLLMTSTVDRVTYDYIYYMNVSRDETNQSHILHNQSTTIFTNFGSRNGLTVTLNGSSTNTTNNVIGNTLKFNVSDTFANDYSLNEGVYYINTNYYVFAASVTPGGGGGSSGDADEDDTYNGISICGNAICEWNENSTNCPQDCPIISINDFIVPTFVNLSMIPSITNKNEIIIRNIGNKTIELMAETICMEDYEEMCNWNWFLVNDKRSSNKLIVLQPFANETITLYTLPPLPLSLTQITYYMHIKFSRVDENIDDASALAKYTQVGETIEPTTKYVTDTWDYEIWSNSIKPIPGLDKNNITTGDLVIISVFILVIILIACKIRKYMKARKVRKMM